MSASALAAADFIPASMPPPLDDGEIHLWFFPQWQHVAGAANSMPIRKLLAAYLDRPIESVCIERGEHGKPRLTGTSLEFNLSHTTDALLLAVGRNNVLGVDLESFGRRTRPVIELARRFFTPDEATALETFPEDLRQTAFLRLWCAKEAALKAEGGGISSGLDRFAFVLDANGQVASSAGSPWHLRAVAPSPAHIGALAHREPVGRVRAFVARI